MIFLFTLQTIDTKLGEEIKSDGVVLVDSNLRKAAPNPIQTALFSCSGTCCPFSLLALATVTDNTDPVLNDLQNDKFAFYFQGKKSSTVSIDIILQAKNCDSWDDAFEVAITDNTYGIFKALGFYDDNYGNTYTSFEIDWTKVLRSSTLGNNAATGVAPAYSNYRIKVVYADIFGNVVTEYSDAEFCLQEYNDYRANKTVRIETITQGTRGDINNPSSIIDFGMTGYKQYIRLEGFFYNEDSAKKEERNQYGYGDNYAIKPIISEAIPKFKLELLQVPGWIDYFIDYVVLMADNILITEFNIDNRHTFVKVPVMNDSGMKVNRGGIYRNQLASLEIGLQSGANNLRKQNS